MKKKLALSTMLVCLLALGFISCDNGTTSDNPPPPSFVAVTSISGVQTSGVKNTVVTLTGTVNPADATNKTIVWVVKSAGTTGATITDGNKLNTTASGTVEVTATISNGLTSSSNFTQDFNISITDSFVPVASISGVPTSGTVGTALTLTGTVNPNNATNQSIVWAVKTAGTTGATINGSTLNTTSSGTVTVTASITNGLTSSSNFEQDFNISITGGSSDNWSILLGIWKWQEGSNTYIQLDIDNKMSMGGYGFKWQYWNVKDELGKDHSGGGSIFACSYIGTTLRIYDPETDTTEKTFTVIVSGDGQTLTFSNYQYLEGNVNYGYMNGKTFTKQP
jgi:hypothetical protein